MNFGRAGFAHHAHDFAAGGAAHDGIIDENHALALDHSTNGIQLQPHAEVTNGLLGLDEGAANIMIANQAHAEWDAGFGGIANRRRHTGIGHGHDHVRVDGMLARQQTAEDARGFGLTGRPKTTLSGREK